MSDHAQEDSGSEKSAAEADNNTSPSTALDEGAEPEQVKKESVNDGSADEKEAKEGAEEGAEEEEKSDAKRTDSQADNDDSPDAKRQKVDEGNPELTTLERAKLAAEKAKIQMLPELDPLEPVPAGTGLPKHQHKYSLSAIRAIKRLKDALPFVAPVDPVKQGVPQYFDYIKHPMDLRTMEKKLLANEYDSVSALVDDFNLVVANCITFNGEEALISKMALSIAQSFKKQLSNMPVYTIIKKGSQVAATVSDKGANNDDESAVHDDTHVGKRSSTTMTVLGPNGIPTIRRKSTIDGRPKREIRPPRQHGGYVGSGTGEGRPRNKKYASELRFCAQIIRELQSRKHESISWPFLAPVDPIEQGIPTYFDVIKEPMDLGTMQKKLNEGIYYTGDEFESDFRLMLRNCYTFNPEGTPVNVLGHKVEDYFNNRWVEKPIPGAQPVDDSDMSDVDDEYAEAGMVNPAIDVLEEQLRLIKKQLKRLKKDALADFYKRGHRKNTAMKRRQPSNSGPAPAVRSMPTEMTYEMKRELRDKIDKLPEKKIRTVLAIIQESMPDLGNNGQDEIELEVDALDSTTLLRLYAYAVLGRKEGPDSGTQGGEDSELSTNGKKKKSRPLSEEEHHRKIAEIESKLKEFDQVAGGSPAGTSETAGSAPSQAAQLAESESSDDEQMDSDSSSEEE